jgi:hypothetical protein
MKKILATVEMVFMFAGIAAGAENITSGYETEEKIVQFEYNGQIIEVSLDDLILTENGLELYDPLKYEGQIQNYDGQMIVQVYTGGQYEQGNKITEEEYNEERKAQRWLNIEEDLEIRNIDEKALQLVREYHQATGAVPPALGQSGTVILAYTSYIPKIVCRPMYVTDIILEPGETVTSIHSGDTARWAFVTGEVGEGSVTFRMEIL